MFPQLSLRGAIGPGQTPGAQLAGTYRVDVPGASQATCRSLRRSMNPKQDRKPRIVAYEGISQKSAYALMTRPHERAGRVAEAKRESRVWAEELGAEEWRAGAEGLGRGMIHSRVSRR